MVNEPSVFEPLKFYCIINLQLCKGSTGPEVIKLFSCSTQLSMKFFLLINVKMPTPFVKMPTTVGILTFMSGKKAFWAALSLKKAEFLDLVGWLFWS